MLFAIPYLASLALAAPPQGVLDPDDLDPPIVIPDDDSYHIVKWPSGTGWDETESFGRWITGNITGGGDAIGVRGKRLFLVESVQSIAALYQFNGRTTLGIGGQQVADAALVKNAGTAGRDLLVTCDLKNGLYKHVYNSGTGFPDFTASAIDTTRDWKDVTRMITADLDQDDNTNGDILGVNDDTVQIYRWQGNGSWTASSTITASDDIVDLVACNYDGMPGLEVACMVDQAVEVYSASSGTLLETISLDAEAIYYVRPMPTHPPHNLNAISDRIVIAYKESGDFKLQLRTSEGTTQAPLDLDIAPDEGLTEVNLKMVAIRTGDWDEDGRVDLLLAHTSYARTVALLRKNSGAYATDDEDFLDRIALEPAGGTNAVPQNVGTPAFWTPSGGYAKNSIVYPANSLPSGGGIAITSSHSAMDPNSNSPGSIAKTVRYDLSEGRLDIRFTMPLGTSFNGDTTWVDARYWGQGVGASPDPDVLQDEVQRNGGHCWSSIAPDGGPGNNLRYIASIPLDAIAEPSQQANAPDHLTQADDLGPMIWFSFRIIEGNADPAGNNNYGYTHDSEFTHFGVRLQSTLR